MGALTCTGAHEANAIVQSDDGVLTIRLAVRRLPQTIKQMSGSCSALRGQDSGWPSVQAPALDMHAPVEAQLRTAAGLPGLCLQPYTG